tara:strand:+ start:1469 stop:1843 length:375 start_codon:yes stop_codon:yes gene_type:complete
MRKTYIIQTQNLEEYGDNYHKFKGGSEYIITFESNKEIYEEDAFGEGIHEYYMSDSLGEASAAALVMQHVNRRNGLKGSFDYITDIEKFDNEILKTDIQVVDHCLSDWFGTVEELINELAQEIK